MSWLFGLNKNPASIPDAIQVPVPISGDEGGDQVAKASGAEGYRYILI